MEIGGTDVIFAVPAELDALSITVERSVALWPQCVVVDDADGFMHRGQHFHLMMRRDREEHLIFRDVNAKTSWEDEGCTESNAADMLQFISRPVAGDAALQEVTLVYFSNREAIRELVENIRANLTSQPQSPSMRTRT
ncbi:MAG: hypothetical protein SGJ19_03960 [Planctomycetia bacterium]|nr:hypothetical protein [Planctomycetia bacterium]